jgi:hypothetical protein
VVLLDGPRRAETAEYRHEEGPPMPLRPQSTDPDRHSPGPEPESAESGTATPEVPVQTTAVRRAGPPEAQATAAEADVDREAAEDARRDLARSLPRRPWQGPDETDRFVKLARYPVAALSGPESSTGDYIAVFRLAERDGRPVPPPGVFDRPLQPLDQEYYDYGLGGPAGDGPREALFPDAEPDPVEYKARRHYAVAYEYPHAPYFPVVLGIDPEDDPEDDPEVGSEVRLDGREYGDPGAAARLIAQRWAAGSAFDLAAAFKEAHDKYPPRCGHEFHAGPLRVERDPEPLPWPAQGNPPPRPDAPHDATDDHASPDREARR